MVFYTFLCISLSHLFSLASRPTHSLLAHSLAGLQRYAVPHTPRCPDGQSTRVHTDTVTATTSPCRPRHRPRYHPRTSSACSTCWNRWTTTSPGKFNASRTTSAKHVPSSGSSRLSGAHGASGSRRGATSRGRRPRVSTTTSGWVSERPVQRTWSGVLCARGRVE
ncbi:hypothetical protein BKA93DRAFT_20174 [Sparassis latifolia]